MEISTKNLVPLKRWDGVKDEKFLYYGSSLKNLIFKGREGVYEKPIYSGGRGGGELPKKGGLESLQF